MIIGQNGNAIEIHAPAKVNFFLELLGRRDDGFHEIDTIMQTVSLWDHLSIRQSTNNDISLSCCSLHRFERDSIPTDGRNLIVRACQRLRDYALAENLVASLPGLNIELRKRIPSAAGLGGASSDCAAALVGANLAWDLNLSKTQIAILAAELGSDVAFFLDGGAARCQGRGEIVTPIDAPAGLDLVIVKPPISLSTKLVFEQVQPTGQTVSADRMLTAIAAGNAASIAAASFNRLDSAARKLTNQIQWLATAFESTGCIGHQMSGSGSSYFGLFASQKSASRVCQQLSAQLDGCRVFAVRTLGPINDQIAFKPHASRTGICSV